MSFSAAKRVRLSLKRIHPVVRNYLCDLRRLRTRSGSFAPNMSAAAIAAHIVKQYRRIAKGRALHFPLPPSPFPFPPSRRPHAMTRGGVRSARVLPPA